MNTNYINCFGENKECLSEKQLKHFLKVLKGHKFECYFKLIMTYGLSRLELLNLEWSDVDFENDEITICPISTIRNNKFY